MTGARSMQLGSAHVVAPSRSASHTRVRCTTCGELCRSQVTRLCRTCFLALPPNRRPSRYYSNGAAMSAATPVLRDPLVTSWHEEGACLQGDPELFYHPEQARGSSKAKRESLAKAICDECPVKVMCRDQARANREEYGVWGGETEVERRAWLRAQRLSERKKAAA